MNRAGDDNSKQALTCTMYSIMAAACAYLVVHWMIGFLS